MNLAPKELSFTLAPKQDINMREQKGLTLTDLAVALVIIGLLLGGVLKGRDLIQSNLASGTTSMLGVPGNPTPNGSYGNAASAAARLARAPVG